MHRHSIKISTALLKYSPATGTFDDKTRNFSSLSLSHGRRLIARIHLHSIDDVAMAIFILLFFLIIFSCLMECKVYFMYLAYGNAFIDI